MQDDISATKKRNGPPWWPVFANAVASTVVLCDRRPAALEPRLPVNFETDRKAVNQHASSFVRAPWLATENAGAIE